MDQKQRPLVELLFQVEILFLERFFNVNWGELGKVELQDSPTAYNTVYVGVKGAPEASTINAPKMISNIPSTEKVAEKPFLVEEDGKWFVYVPLVWLRGFRWEHGWCFILFFLFASKSVQKSPGGLNFNHFNNFSIFLQKKTSLSNHFFDKDVFPQVEGLTLFSSRDLRYHESPVVMASSTILNGKFQLKRCNLYRKWNFVFVG